jgi:hypothetical protein
VNPAEQLVVARRLIESGHPRQACGILRPLLEQYLKSRCASTGVDASRLMIAAMVHALSDAGKLDAAERSRLLHWNALGNVGSHAGTETVSVEDAEYFLRGMAERLELPAPARTTNLPVRRHGNTGTSRDHDRLTDEQRRKTFIAAFYLSKFGHKQLGMGNQDETFALLADRLAVKKNTLKNRRDAFDPHTDSGRRGWWQKELNSEQKAILREFKTATEPELRKILLQMLPR